MKVELPLQECFAHIVTAELFDRMKKTIDQLEEKKFAKRDSEAGGQSNGTRADNSDPNKVPGDMPQDTEHGVPSEGGAVPLESSTVRGGEISAPNEVGGTDNASDAKESPPVDQSESGAVQPTTANGTTEATAATPSESDSKETGQNDSMPSTSGAS